MCLSIPAPRKIGTTWQIVATKRFISYVFPPMGTNPYSMFIFYIQLNPTIQIFEIGEIGFFFFLVFFCEWSYVYSTIESYQVPRELPASKSKLPNQV